MTPADRQRAFRKLTTLLKPGGLIVISLRAGEAACLQTACFSRNTTPREQALTVGF